MLLGGLLHTLCIYSALTTFPEWLLEGEKDVCITHGSAGVVIGDGEDQRHLASNE